MRLSRLKMTELGISTGRDPIAVEGVQRAMLGPMFAGKPIIFDWDEEDLRFRSGAGGRLVRVLLADGNELMVSTMEGAVFVYDIAAVDAELATSGEEISRRISQATGLFADESGIAPLRRLRLVP